eukprot:TRINITY_DN6881_c0_g1_i1.p1 TRINITY_DN6881_c0_g1~~TRINITY_DN6881_c0_g1_i1.p1  ORF type:complete len:322 (+),score=80.59 TRINITY_DN6881_c0_g1_i1:68-1033(+)
MVVLYGRCCRADLSRRSVTMCRLLAGAAVATSVVYSEYLSLVLADLWGWAKATALVQNDTFEPLLSTAAFAVWLAVFRLCDCCPSLQKYRLSRDHEQREGLAVFTKLGDMPALKSGVAYLVPLAVIDFAFPRRVYRMEGAWSEAPSWGRFCMEVAASIALYDFLFYWVHLAMHKLPWAAALHNRHHMHKPAFAADVLRHGLIDGSLQVVCNVVALNVLRSHALSRAAHDVAVTYLLTETHAGYDLPWMLHNLLPGVWGGAPRHDLHHRTGRHCFAQFTCYLDDVLGYGPTGSDVIRSDSDDACAQQRRGSVRRAWQGDELG